MTELENARMEVVASEREIQMIKAALRKFSAPGDAEETPNTLQVSWVGIDGAPGEGGGVDLSLQLSSPIEQAVLSKMAAAAEGAEEAEDTSISFSGVETSVATLTVTLRKDGEVVGTSESYDLAPLCKIEDVMNPKDEYVKELPVAIIAPGAKEAAAEGESKTEETTEEKTKEEEGTEEKTEDAAAAEGADTKEEETKKEDEKPSGLIKPLCTLTLRLVYKPSDKDQKEELYEMLNKTSQRKLQALEKLRGQSAVVAKKTPSTVAKKSPAVKAGFLNKKVKKQEDDPKWKQFYKKYLGPESFLQVVFPVAKNYIIFFGAVALAHFQGQLMALPAPV
jgi:hypothetical protein